VSRLVRQDVYSPGKRLAATRARFALIAGYSDVLLQIALELGITNRPQPKRAKLAISRVV
jgi:hypothetical protein